MAENTYHVENNRCTAVRVRKGAVLTSCGIPSGITCNDNTSNICMVHTYTRKKEKTTTITTRHARHTNTKEDGACGIITCILMTACDTLVEFSSFAELKFLALWASSNTKQPSKSFPPHLAIDDVTRWISVASQDDRALPIQQQHRLQKSTANTGPWPGFPCPRARFWTNDLL